MANSTRSLSICALLLLAAGCGTSSNSGVLGKAVFNASNCGGVLSNLSGCDLSTTLAVGGLVDVRAVANAGSQPLQLRSDLPGVLDVKDIGGAAYTLTGGGTGTATLTAFNGSGDVDHIDVKVGEISEIAYNTVSNGSGTFVLQQNGDTDGTYTLGSGVTNFTLLFLQVDAGAHSLLGRDTFTYELSTGLSFQAGKDQPHALEFDLARPAQAGNYTLLVRAKYGGGRFKMLLVVN